jgi:hypothetical protein
MTWDPDRSEPGQCGSCVGRLTLAVLETER